MDKEIRIAPIIISALVVLAFFCVLVLLIVRPIEIKAEIANILMILTGTLSAKFGDVVQYHIGSSSGSKEKDELHKELLLQQVKP